ncbi:Placenta-specific protein 8 protein [Bulinus truncatus]|nr:Placenta-specific protein 8 protein [Bulinus truncatus]
MMSALMNVTSSQAVAAQPDHSLGHPVVNRSPGHIGTLTTCSDSFATVVQQPTPGLKPRNWSSGLCACTEDKKICCQGCWCLPCLACQVSQDLGESFCLPCCIPCAYINVLRFKMRTEQNILGSAMDDCCPVCCCPSCALCQLAREIKHFRLSQQTISVWSDSMVTSRSNCMVTSQGDIGMVTSRGDGMVTSRGDGIVTSRGDGMTTSRHVERILSGAVSLGNPEARCPSHPNVPIYHTHLREHLYNMST